MGTEQAERRRTEGRMSERWIRLNTTWSQSDWVAALEPEARLVWLELLCHVKAHGYDGKVKAPGLSAFARNTGVTRNAVTVLVDAATEHGALEIDGDDWVVTAWQKYQGDTTAADRQRRYRERKQEVTENDTVTPVTRDVTPVTPTETETETREQHLGASGDAPSLKVRYPASPPKKGRNIDYPEDFEMAWTEYPERDGPNPKTGAYKAWRARAVSNDSAVDLANAARHYAMHVRQTEKEGTPFVMQASTFYGPKEPWRDYIDPPKARTNPNGHEYRPAHEMTSW